MRRRERALSILAIFGSFIGGAGLILLSVFDTKRHSSAHRAFLLVFIVGVGLSAIFTVIEVRLTFCIQRFWSVGSPVIDIYRVTTCSIGGLAKTLRNFANLSLRTFSKELSLLS